MHSWGGLFKRRMTIETAQLQERKEDVVQEKKRTKNNIINQLKRSKDCNFV